MRRGVAHVQFAKQAAPSERAIHSCEMILPAHVVDQIQAVLATMGTDGLHVDNEAARHGGIALMGTIGATWLLRPDGTFWGR